MTSAEQAPRVIVEVDVFSGRPNPSWQLDPGQAQLMLRMLDDVLRSGRSGHPCAAPGLGYRGLNVKVVQGTRTSDWRVFDGCIEHDGRAFDDAKASIEAYALRAMPPQLKSDLAAVLPRVDR